MRCAIRHCGFLAVQIEHDSAPNHAAHGTQQTPQSSLVVRSMRVQPVIAANGVGNSCDNVATNSSFLSQSRGSPHCRVANLWTEVDYQKTPAEDFARATINYVDEDEIL